MIEASLDGTLIKRDPIPVISPDILAQVFAQDSSRKAEDFIHKVMALTGHDRYGVEQYFWEALDNGTLALNPDLTVSYRRDP